MFNEIQSLFHLKSNYFRQCWSYIELGILIRSWTNVGIYLWKYKEGQGIGNLFAQSNGYVYINDLLTFFSWLRLMFVFWNNSIVSSLSF
jgi:hypothetical protein